MALRSVQRLERRGGFRSRLFDGRSQREYVEYQAIARIQGTESETVLRSEEESQACPSGLSAGEPHGAHERLERLLRGAVHRGKQGPE